jgi:hypothetical protein
MPVICCFTYPVCLRPVNVDYLFITHRLVLGSESNPCTLCKMDRQPGVHLQKPAGERFTLLYGM